MKKLQFALIPLILVLGGAATWWILQKPAGQSVDPHGHGENGHEDHGHADHRESTPGTDRHGHDEHGHDKHDHGAEHASRAEPRVGPRGGKLVGDDHFGVEVTIYEKDAPPRFRLFAYHDGRLLPATETKVTIELARLDGEKNTFSFRPEGDALVGDGVVAEPHSFDVTVRAEHDGEIHTWTYASPEGRTVISSAAARESGMTVSTAGPATITDQLTVHGLIQPDAERIAVVAPRFGGLVKTVAARLGERVAAGSVLATVQSNDTLATYEVTAPFAGTVLAKNIAPGAIAGSETSFTLVDLSVVWAEFQVFQRDLGRVRPGQRVTFTSTGGGAEGEGVVAWVSPVGSPSTQSVTARVVLDNADGRWAPGLAVTGIVQLGTADVALAVQTDALQTFRDFTVVFAQVGDTYEVRMLELGRRDARHAEVLGGLKPGTRYVATNSFLVKADIEKSGASHDH